MGCRTGNRIGRLDLPVPRLVFGDQGSEHVEPIGRRCPGRRLLFKAGLDFGQSPIMVSLALKRPDPLGEAGKRVSFDEPGKARLCRTRRPMLKTIRMEDAPIIRKYTDFDEMKADEYRYWQSRPAHERLDAVEEMIQTAYALKGWKIEPDEPRLQGPFVRLPCPWR